MKRILKFPLLVTDEQSIELPSYAKILTAQAQNGTLCVWAECDDSVPGHSGRTFHVIGTRNPMPDVSLEYIATVQQSPFVVWHVYVEPEWED